VLLFGLQGEQIMRQPIVIALLAVPILLQVYFNAGLAYWLNRLLGVEWCVAGPSALIGASNFFELAVAAAIALFGFQSGSQRSSAYWWKCRSCCRSPTSSAVREDGMSARSALASRGRSSRRPLQASRADDHKRGYGYSIQAG
jgi:hypothetical protein